VSDRAKPWMTEVRIGHKLTIKPLWNKTERNNQVPVPCEIVGIEATANSQSGFMFSAYTNAGRLRRLDANWFQEPTK
jgi:hypothetical protein